MKSQFIIAVVLSFVFACCGRFQQKETQSVMSIVEDGVSQQSANPQQNESRLTMRQTVDG